jgi:hypothetical protein
MNHELPFSEVLDAVDRLSAEEQEALLAIVQRRVAERGRQRVKADVSEARRDFASGLCKPVSPDELMDEILS